MKVGKFRSKPVVINAALWDGSIADATAIIDYILKWNGTARFRYGFEREDGLIAIDTLEGTMEASPGDWIIQGTRGEFYPCKPDVFATKYEEVDDGEDRTTAAEQAG